MNLENSDEYNYIKIDVSNKNKLKNKFDSKEENLDLKTVIESFEQQITLEELDPFIFKLIPKNYNDLFKMNLEQSKLYKKKFSFTKRNLIDSVNRILATDFKSNFVFNRQNLEDITCILIHIFNMFINIEMMNEKKSERAFRLRNNKLKTHFYSNQNFKYFNSTGNLPIVHELRTEENFENNNDSKTSKSKKNKETLYRIYSSDSESEDIDENNKGGKKKIGKIKRRSLGYSIKSKNCSLFTEDNKIFVTKDYFIYPENNYGLDENKQELPIELIILLKKFEKIEILTFQIRDSDEKLLKQNIFLLFNISILFPNFTEIKIDLNDEELQKKVNNIYETRGQELMNKFKKNIRIFQYNQEYRARTVNCWEPEGDILFITKNDDDNNIKYKYTSFGNNYVLGENPFENSNYFGNNLKNIIDEEKNINSGKITCIQYIMPLKGENPSFLNTSN